MTDLDGTIVAINRLWRREVQRRHLDMYDVGRDYRAGMESQVRAGDAGVRPFLQAFNEVLAGNRKVFRCVYAGSGALRGSDYNILISTIEVAGDRYVFVSAQNMTQVNDLKRERRRLGGQILHAQERERRRLARELHDSTSQLLVVLKLNLARMESARGKRETRDVIAECKQAVDEVQQQIRSLSFIAHPPDLSSSNLEDTLRALTTGFAARTGLDIQLQMSDVGRASGFVEVALYRLAQESLANIHRHAGATRAAMRLVGTDRCLHLLIADDGVGFDVASQRAHPLGVGVAGMGERVRELGGRFSIRRTETETALSASLPRHTAALPLASAVE